MDRSNAQIYLKSSQERSTFTLAFCQSIVVLLLFKEHCRSAVFLHLMSILTSICFYTFCLISLFLVYNLYIHFYLYTRMVLKKLEYP